MDSFFTDEKIIYFLCRVRAKFAQQRSKKHLIHLLTNDPKFNHHGDEKVDDEKLLLEILPARRKWKKLKKHERYKSNYQRLNSIEYNTKCLFKTIHYYRKNQPEEPFVEKLMSFVKDIQESINDDKYAITKPQTYPKLKDKIRPGKNEKNVCRPIALFGLKDKIIISQTNKYLTQKLDSLFYKNAHAFRTFNKKGEMVNHHTSIEELLNYKLASEHRELWVSECDMSKFYDSVSHEVIVDRFNDKLSELHEKGEEIDQRAIRLFHSFLSSYNFVHDVLPLNQNEEFWRKRNIPNGSFGWVEKELIELGHYENIDSQKIGIPQGGALSGLIANIVLSHADESIQNLGYNELLYIRFCDDMIIMNPDSEKCKIAADQYHKALLELKLVPHDFKSGLTNTAGSFWKCKSKSPYKWSNNHTEKDVFPWIGFVGYEIHFDGSIRIRKSSLKKELQKQKETIHKIINAIEKKKRARNGTVIESAKNRLLGMSVGRVQMWNHDELLPDMCWVNGFKKLNDNPYLKKQLRQLDKGRNHQMAKLKKALSDHKDPKKELKENRKTIYIGKPFSYYHQTLRDK